MSRKTPSDKPIRVPANLHERAKAAATKEGMTLRGLVTVLLGTWLQQKKAAR